ncbi:hypothetical protein ALC56_04060, partial [Trachymyrmex septentrionalis]
DIARFGQIDWFACSNADFRRAATDPAIPQQLYKFSPICCLPQPICHEAPSHVPYLQYDRLGEYRLYSDSLQYSYDCRDPIETRDDPELHPPIVLYHWAANAAHSAYLRRTPTICPNAINHCPVEPNYDESIMDSYSLVTWKSVSIAAALSPGPETGSGVTVASKAFRALLHSFKAVSNSIKYASHEVILMSLGRVST